jgi:threonine synthase
VETLKKVLGYKCTICSKEFDSNAKIYTCSYCGTTGILDVLYDYSYIKKTVTKTHFAQNNNYSMWRYASLISVKEESLRQSLRVGWSPLYQSRRLASILGLKHLYIKDDGLNPTGSLKDRASAVAIAKAIEEGADTIACSSTGNAASSLAGNAANMGLKTVIFVPERAPLGKVAQLLIYGAQVISVVGDYQDTFKLSAAAIEKWGWYNRNAGINPHLVEGKKTVSLEIAEQLAWGVPDWVVVSVGDGCTIGGVYKGFYDLLQLGIIERIPKILGVQAAGCSPLYDAFLEDRPFTPTAENTLADSIAVGVPRNPVKALNAVKYSGGTWITVTDEEILAAMRLLGANEGIFAEPAGAAGLAGLVKSLGLGKIKANESVAVVATGNGLKDVNSAIKAVGSPVKVKPELAELDKVINLG